MYDKELVRETIQLLEKTLENYPAVNWKDVMGMRDII